MATTQSSKPKKPRPDFPLFPHASGQWAKKIRGKLHYFGKWDDSKAALNAYLDQRDYLHSGRQAPTKDVCSVAILCNSYLTAKDDLLANEEISRQHFQDCKRTCEAIVKHFGRNHLVSDIEADDLAAYRKKLAKQYTLFALGIEIQRARSVFNWGWEAGVLNVPVRFGPNFKRPKKAQIRKHQAKQETKLFEADEIRLLMDKAPQQLKTMILLGVNCALGNNDVSEIEWKHIDLDKGWHYFGRTKTGVERSCPLWPETVEALKGLPRKKSQERVFLTCFGKPWIRWTDKDVKIDTVSREFCKLTKDAKIHRKGVGFYSLRHTFATIGAETGLQTVVNHVMGHVDSSMAANYRHKTADDLLLKVTDHVHGWLFGQADDVNVSDDNTHRL